MTKPKSFTSDVVIVGAGLMGTACALSLQRLGLSIRILEKHLPDFTLNAENNSRPISLSYGSYRLLSALGVWDDLAACASPILSVHVSEQGQFGITRFSASEQNVPALGYVVPVNALQKALYQHAAAQPRIDIQSISALEKIENKLHGVCVYTENEKIDATVLIATDGTNSTCRDLLKIKTIESVHDDVAHIYQLQLKETHHYTAYERFTEYGVLAVLPLHNQHMAQLVWAKKKCECEKNADDKLRIVQQIFEGRLSIASIKKIAEFPLKTMMAETQITKSAVLLGNAAHTIYPVAAQGFNLGLHDIGVFYDVLYEALQNKQSIGNLSVLKKYEATSKNHQEKIFRLTNQWIGLFELPLIGAMRGLGLLATDIIKPLKNKLAKRTMGVTEKISRLLQGDHA